MAATVSIRRYTGAGPGSASADRSGGGGPIRASNSDNDYTTETANPIPIPAAGTNYSFWVTTSLFADTTPAGTINNLRWFSDGSNSFGTGVGADMGDASTGTDAGYRQATAAIQLTTGNHTGLDAAPAGAFTLTSGSPRTLGGSISNPTTGRFGDFAVWQINVASTAGPGELPVDEQFTFRYDET